MEFLQCFDVVGWAAGRASGQVICLERGADFHMAQLMPLPLTVSCFSKIQMVLPSWYRLTRVVPDKGPLNGCVCVYMYVCGAGGSVKETESSRARTRRSSRLSSRSRISLRCQQRRGVDFVDEIDEVIPPIFSRSVAFTSQFRTYSRYTSRK